MSESGESVQEWLQRINRGIESGPYRDDWASLSAWRVPAWYEPVKFGIFIHWGVFSVPAFDNDCA
ncbi:MAG: alpha-L-fucosidase [Clostridia bacterium]|nr:alpha-L-fucosidase [Clostridia bacterium]